MGHSPSGQSPSDRIHDAECSQPQMTHPTNDIQTSFEELCIQQTGTIPTDTHLVKSLIDDANIEATLETSYGVGPVSLVTSHTAIDHDSQLLTKLSRTVEQAANFTDGDKKSYSSINNCVLVTNPPIQVKKSKEEEPNKPSSDNSKIPQDSTDFIYDGKTIPVHIEQLYGTEMIDHGIFGSVYPVIIKGSPDTLMAVKRVPCSMTNEVTTMELVGSGSCPYIVDYYCALIHPIKSELCICMELMDTSVAKFYQAIYSLDTVLFDQLDNFVRRVAHDIASALSYLEIKEIVHRDIKPANMLINKSSVVKLCDFGIARTFSKLKSDFEGVVGTANYLAPTLEHTIQDDMWALGISLLEIVSGKHPFVDWDAYGLSFAILEWEPSVPATISVDMQELILHLLKKQPQERPSSYLDILNKPCICSMNQMPSDDECNFVRHVIEKIPQTGSKDY